MIALSSSFVPTNGFICADLFFKINSEHFFTELQERFTFVFEDFEQQGQIEHEEHVPIDHYYPRRKNLSLKSRRTFANQYLIDF